MRSLEDDANERAGAAPGPGDDAERAEQAERRTGLLFGLGAYSYWAFVFPLHLHLLNTVAPASLVQAKTAWSLEILGQRVAWSLIVCLGLLTWLRRWGRLRATLGRPRSLATLAATASLVSVNWGVFIYAVSTEQLYRGSIGYFITPLVSALLGVIFLGERPRPWQWGAFGVAACGIAWLVLDAGHLPWIELTLACSFGLYGLLRKRVDAGPIVGLSIETAALTPAALGYLAWAALAGEQATGFARAGLGTSLLLAATGLSTALPLLWFASAARRLPLVTIGFLQFLAPTGQFVLSLILGNEPPDGAWPGYVLIWAGVVVFATESYAAARRRRRAKSVELGLERA